jgi:iron complex transport system substrate-binding protein
LFKKYAVALLISCIACADAPQIRQDRRAQITVTDDASRAVQLDAPAKRVVSLMPTVTDLIVAMNEHHRLIARTDYDTDEKISHLPSLGGGLTPSVEWIASRRPDLVISWPDQGSRSLVDQLASVRIPVYSARTESIRDTYRILGHVGQLLGIESKADSLSNALHRGLQSVRESVRGRPAVKVLYVVSIDPPMIAAGGTFIDELITVAGGTNLFSELKLWPQVNLEEVLQRDPDIVVLADTGKDDPYQLLSSLAGWRELRAVKQRRVYRVSPYFFNRSGPTMPQAAAELARFFHGR